MTVFLSSLLAYLISLAASERSSALNAKRERKLIEATKNEEDLFKALASADSIRGEVSAACVELVRNRARFGVTPPEEGVWLLLNDDVFQADLAEWLMAGAIEEGDAVKTRILQTIETALVDGGASPEQITHFKNDYFEAVEKAVYANPILSRWRHQLSLDYLREQVVELRRHAEEATGIYSEEKQESAIDRYCETALAAWDIIDLSNLPADDIEIGTQQLMLRQLYMPLRIEVEPTQQGEADDAAIARLEKRRDSRRRREAGHVTDAEHAPKPLSSVGERLAASRRLVVLGDPGGGKTTMLRWMATAYLLRQKGDAAFSRLPDTDTLPELPWIPVLIRCRDLGENDLCSCFTDFLTQHLNKTELLPEEATVMRTVVLDRMAKGEALLLADGLDEITNPRVRVMFCQQIERTAARYPNAPIVVTSRIVGYRDMPYRMGPTFEHGQIAELSREDKDLFARRWVEVTEPHQPPAEQTNRVYELTEALHSSDRIERLTGNPMLLTTLALVKRKVGKLPNRRTKLYAEAVSVLLNWNPRLYKTIDEDEAIPQLEYLAFEMCRLGIQRLANDEILDLLDRIRTEYPNIRAIRRREPQEFLKHLEERSSLLIRSGGIWQSNRVQQKPAWEFRHLTFQEYLAARALIDGRYPARDKTQTLAKQVAPLAGNVVKSKGDREAEIPESWREALRLLVADCKDDDVDEVLLCILNPASTEDKETTERPRAVLAALCLTDEPNVSEETARIIIDKFVSQVRSDDASGRVHTSITAAGVELGKCIWAEVLRQSLMKEYRCRAPDDRTKYGGLYAVIAAHCPPNTTKEMTDWYTNLVTDLQSVDETDRTCAALTVMELIFLGRELTEDGLKVGLIAMLAGAPPERFAAAWALGWLCREGSAINRRKPIWVPKAADVDVLLTTLDTTESQENDTLRWLIFCLGASGDRRATHPIAEYLDHHEVEVRQTVVRVLGNFGDKQAVPPLLMKLDDKEDDIRRDVINALGRSGDQQAVPPLLTILDEKDDDIRGEAIIALGRLGDRQVVTPLNTLLDELTPTLADEISDDGDSIAVIARIAATLSVLGEPRGTDELHHLLTSNRRSTRNSAVAAYAQLRDDVDRQLLSMDLDSVDPWLDPSVAVSEARITLASNSLDIPTEQIASRYEAMAVDLKLNVDSTH